MKFKQRGELAINGGLKTVPTEQQHYVWPPITERTRDAVLGQLEDQISLYNRSNIVARLEDKFMAYHGKRHALLTNSGTIALYSMYVGAGFKEGDEVICPAYTFFATATPLFHMGVVPVLADSDATGNISARAIEEKITDRTKGIVVTHMWGLPCDMDAIMDVANKYGIPVFEDGSHAHGAVYRGRKVGTFGEAAAFSLQGKKTVTAGEGGIIVTDNDDIYYRAVLFGHFNKRCLQEIPEGHELSRFSITGMGLNLRIHPIAAAIADQQFDGLDEVLAGRRKVASRLIRELGSLPGIEVPQVPDDVKPTWYAFVMQYKPEEFGGLHIEKFYRALLAEGCAGLDRPSSTRPLNYLDLFKSPEVLFPQYAGMPNPNNTSFPNAERFYQNALKLPVWHSEEDATIVDSYVDAFKKVVRNYGELL